MIEAIPADTLSQAWSDFFVYGSDLVLLALATIAIGLAVRAHRDARRARNALDPDVALAEGPAVVAGAVQHLPSADLAVRVEIDQVPREKESSGNWSHKWVETERRVKVTPFYLQRPTGERIRVEPTEDVFLIDDMDGCIHYDRLLRTRIAELIPGEQVIAVGELRRVIDSAGHGHGYRDVPMGWVLSGARRGPILLSSEPLADRFARRRRFHSIAAGAILATLLAMQLLVLGHYARRSGTTSMARVESKRHYITRDSDDDEKRHWEVTASTPWSTRHVGDIENQGWNEIERGSVVPIRHRGRDYVQFGSDARVEGVIAFFCVLIVVAAIAGYAFAARRSRRWYESKVVDRGEGRINPSTGLG